MLEAQKSAFEHVQAQMRETETQETQILGVETQETRKANWGTPQIQRPRQELRKMAHCEFDQTTASSQAMFQELGATCMASLMLAAILLGPFMLLVTAATTLQSCIGPRTTQRHPALEPGRVSCVKDK